MTFEKKAEVPQTEITKADYQALAEFRYVIRRFMEFSEKAAQGVGLQPRQHQALLAIKGAAGDEAFTVGDLAERLCIRHHSAVELVNRLCEGGLVLRQQDKGDQRRVLVRLTQQAQEHLAVLSPAHLDELSRIEPILTSILSRTKA